LRYRDGNGVPRDLGQARTLFKKSAGHGNDDAAAALAKLLPAAVASSPTNSLPIVIRSAEFGMGKDVADVTTKVTELLNTRAGGFSADAKRLVLILCRGRKSVW